MTSEQIQQEIDTKREELQNFLMEANKQAAWYEGYIAALQALLENNEVKDG